MCPRWLDPCPSHPHDALSLPTGARVDRVSPPSTEDGDVPANRPDTVGSAASTPSPSTPSPSTPSTPSPPTPNTLAQSVYKSFTTSSLLRVLMHTTQPMFNGKRRWIHMDLRIRTYNII
ncbi:hypothetical protein EYF80_068124 [Liparis tanakae]|uniref:Uncharacterized protein n=1 Tax=Liparis tanakae TaxID=230148 RepID=A0A4Z2DYZ2_9TELE|nr:hypothetical protein EYF80_068124 [Liparis tanakae]